MKKLRIWILKNWWILCAGALLTIVFTRMMYSSRGYFAFGSEWLTIPVILGIKRALKVYKGSLRKR